MSRMCVSGSSVAEHAKALLIATATVAQEVPRGSLRHYIAESAKFDRDSG
jgi:hypothetical protein